MEAGTPTENRMRYYCYCGRQLQEVPYEDAALAVVPDNLSGDTE
jgi:hypothetical protein